MKDADRAIIREKIIPILHKAEASLLLGAGFSIKNSSALGKLPNGEELRDMILARCGKVAGSRTTLKDAYLLGAREIPDFREFLAECFTVTAAFPWQEKIFNYAWSRIYTTNIDNVLNIAHDACKSKSRLGGDFSFVNYSDPSILSIGIGSIPVVTIHGTCAKLDEGFIFSSLEYAKAAVKVLDWHRDIAAKMMIGGLIVIGNQLDESDIDAHMALREIAYAHSAVQNNFLVMPDPDVIKKENYESAGYHVIDCTAEEFFEAVYAAGRPKTIAEIVIESTPSLKRYASDLAAMTWFRNAFRPVIVEIDEARKETGILRHFLMGSEPEWFYIVNEAHALTSPRRELVQRIAEMMKANAIGIGVLHVIGPSGSGKSTAIKAALAEVVRTYPYVYEFDNNREINTDLLRRMLESFSEKSIFVFYSAAEYYFAINYVSDRLGNSDGRYALFILEDRTNDYRKNSRQITDPDKRVIFEYPPLNTDDATLLAQKIQESGLIFEKFSEFELDRRARIIVDKERGFGGDLLSALFSLTTHQNFEQKIFQEYHAVVERIPRQILNVVATLNCQGFSIPVDYIAGFLNERIDTVARHLSEDLAGVLITQPRGGAVKCRHRIIAQYYFDNCISRSGDVDTIVGILEFLSRKFYIEDIKYHPLAYRIYKEIISFEFLFETYYPVATRRRDTERTYHEAQRFFNLDGVFWLHFGRYYRKTQRWDEAIECFRTGLTFYDSFQTRHSLGTALIEKYIHNGCNDLELYREGVSLLEEERARRGTTDPYPTTTLLALLSRVVSIETHNADAKRRLVDCINAGIKHFSADEYFKRELKRYFSMHPKLPGTV